MKNGKRILSLGLGMALLLGKPAYADMIISPLDPSGTAQNIQGGAENQGPSEYGTAFGGGQALTGAGSPDAGRNAPQTGGSQAVLQAPGSEAGGAALETQPPGNEAGGAAQGTPQAPGNETDGPGYGTGADSSAAAGGLPAGAGSSGLSVGVYSTKEPVSGAGDAGAEIPQNPQVSEIPDPQIAAEGAVLYDVTHDAFLFEKNADRRFYPASITKLMTALVVLEHADLSETVTFSKTATTNLESGAVTLKLAEGDKVSVKDCMYALLLKSANEVANGLAEHVAGSVPKFAGMMNAKAKELGCAGTNFVNPNGLNDPNHYTTCRDMARIAKAAFADQALCRIDTTMNYAFPATKNVNQTRTLTPGHKMFYPNDSRYYPGIVGGKTGYTSLAGNTLVTCAEQDGVRLIAVVMKARSTQYADTKALFDYGYAVARGGAVSDSGFANALAGSGASYNRWIESRTGEGADAAAVWMFETAGGGYVGNGCVTIDGDEYLFDAAGRMLSGWQSINGFWYCFGESGAMAKNRWMQDQDKWFYLGNDGKMVTNAVIDGQYRVGADGVLVL